MIQFWAFIYRLTGWYSPFAKLAEYKYIKSNLSQIEEQHKNSNITKTLEALIGLRIGLWQADKGFVRPFRRTDLKKIINRAKKRVKK